MTRNCGVFYLLRKDFDTLLRAARQNAVQPERIVALTASMKDARMLPPAGLHLPLPAGMPFAEGLDKLRAVLEGIRVKASA